MNDAQKFILLTGAVVTGTYLFTVVAKGSPPPDDCGSHTTQSECESNGCFWWDDGTCHPYQQNPGDPTQIIAVYSDGSEHPFPASSIQTAINDVKDHSPGGTGDVWLASGTFNISSLSIDHDAIRIHGWGMDESAPYYTRLNCTGSEFGIIASKNPFASGNAKYQYGLRNLMFDNFIISGSGLYAVTRQGLRVENVYAVDITNSYAGIRAICPFGEKMMEGVEIINCHTLNTSSHGFALWTTNVRGCTYKDILFDGCSSIQAGHGNTSNESWSVGYNFGEVWEVTHDDDDAYLVNLTVQNCEAYEAWESGFHIENKIRKTNVHFFNCTSNDNGRKYIESSPPSSGFCCPKGCSGTWSEAWCNPYGAGFLHSYKDNPADNTMTFEDCTANGNGFCGFRNRSSSNHPVFTNCTGDDYPSGNINGNGRGTEPWRTEHYPNLIPTGGLCLRYCTGITNTNP